MGMRTERSERRWAPDSQMLDLGPVGLAGWPAHGATRQHMGVKVLNALAGRLTRVDDGAVAPGIQPQLRGDSTNATQHLAEQCIVCGARCRQRREVTPRDHQHMGGRLRSHVAKGDDGTVLVDKARAKLATGNPAENAS